MGTHTSGELNVGLSRELSEPEYEAWLARIKAGRPGPRPCANTSHQGAPLEVVVPASVKTRTVNGATVEEITDARVVCEHFDPTPNAAGFCYASSEDFAPDEWSINGDPDIWGDVGVLNTSPEGFDINVGGKVYDIVDAATWTVEALPEGVTADGDGHFESDSEYWALAVRGREVREVGAWVFVEGDEAPKGSIAWTLGHVNFVDGSVSLAVYSSEREARIAYGDELREHLSEDAHGPEDLTNIGERVGHVPWIAHFVADGECLTYLDRVTVR